MLYSTRIPGGIPQETFGVPPYHYQEQPWNSIDIVCLTSGKRLILTLSLPGAPLDDLTFDLTTPSGIAIITVIGVSLLKHLVLKRLLIDFTYLREVILFSTLIIVAILSLINRYTSGSDGETITWLFTIQLFIISYAASIAAFETVGKRIETMITDWLTPKEASEPAVEETKE